MNVALDVAIGIAFLYLLLALLVTTAQELIATWWQFRAKDLYEAIAGMLSSDGTVPEKPTGKLKEFLEHPLIGNLREPKSKRTEFNFPSYLEPRVFAAVIVDIFLGGKAPSQVTGVGDLLTSLTDSVNKIENNEGLKKSLLAVLREAERWEGNADTKAAAISKAIADWFNDRMARASGWYKRRAQTWALIMAGMLAVIANADSLHVGQVLWLNSTLRESIVAGAQAFVATQQPPVPTSPVASASPPSPGSPVAEAGKLIGQAKEQLATLGNANFPIGWSGVTWSVDYLSELWFWKAAIFKLCGWLITALAVSLGATFWFDGIGKLLQLRGTGPKIPATSGRGADGKA